MLARRLLITIGAFLFIVLIVGGFTAYGFFTYFSNDLPQIMKIEDYKPLLVTKVYDRNNKKVGEFFRERRILVPYAAIPQHVVQAFLAAEDDTFFEHKGVNFIAILRASIANFKAGRTVQGGSTITQQLAKTLLLSNEKTLARKFKEALLAMEMEKHLKKDEILYLYLNQIYFGASAYGIQMAAETYFRKDVKDLTLAEGALLASLPKAPSAFSPVRNPSRAKERQVYVLNRMQQVGFAKKEQVAQALQEPIKIYLREDYEDKAPFYLETVRQLLVEKVGEKALLDEGLKVYTALDAAKQEAAEQSLVAGLKELDKRQGYRGAIENISDEAAQLEFLKKSREQMLAKKTPERTIMADGNFKSYGEFNDKFDITKGLPSYIKLFEAQKGIVQKVDDADGLVTVQVAEVRALIDFDSFRWARKADTSKKPDADLLKKPSDALKVGDVVLLQIEKPRFEVTKRLAKNKNYNFTKFAQATLDQDPIVQGALLSLDQKTQEIIAMVGGYNFENSKFNRTFQAARQTGSSFKSLVYAAALDKGYTASSPIMDAPLVFQSNKEDSEGQEQEQTWKPANHDREFQGDIILRNALVRSLNIPTIKIIEDIGVPYATMYSHRLGVFSSINPDFTMALGSSSVTLYEMTKAFAVFGRNGQRLRPVLVKKVVDQQGKNLTGVISLDERFKNELGELEKNFESKRVAFLSSGEVPKTEGEAQMDKKVASQLFFSDPEQLIHPTTAYIMTSILRGVVEDPNGTGGRAAALGRPVAAKTGSTNGYFDAWFVGYTAQIATGTWVGFDQERSIGKGEVGGRAALPIWLRYMKEAHEGLPVEDFVVPEGIVEIKVDAVTGRPPASNSKRTFTQAFVDGTQPTSIKDSTEEDADFIKQDLSD